MPNDDDSQNTDEAAAATNGCFFVVVVAVRASVLATNERAAIDEKNCWKRPEIGSKGIEHVFALQVYSSTSQDPA